MKAWSCSVPFNPDYEVVPDAVADSLLVYDKLEKKLKLKDLIPNPEALNYLQMETMKVCDAQSSTDGTDVNFCTIIKLKGQGRRLKSAVESE